MMIKMSRRQFLPFTLTPIVASAALRLKIFGQSSGPNLIAKENSTQPGANNLLITSQNAVLAPGTLEAFPSQHSIQQGENLKLHISNSEAAYYEVLRGGWYEGFRATSKRGPVPVAARIQSARTLEPVTRMIECPWDASDEFRIPDNWVTGHYLVKLTSSSGKQAYTRFIVRDDASRSDILVVDDTTTEVAYNPDGGISLYPLSEYNHRAAGGAGQFQSAVRAEQQHLRPIHEPWGG
jgi:hypothetical protein